MSTIILSFCHPSVQVIAISHSLVILSTNNFFSQKMKAKTSQDITPVRIRGSNEK
uniref:Uncharacterized protein n=1 Tax=Rhizophora mucronata TaxID=61149 RepID=A0A2P2N7M4_RHIMU